MKMSTILNIQKSNLIETSLLGRLSNLIIKLLSKLEEQTRGKEKLVALGLIILGGHLYYFNKYSYWSRRNVKHPMPLPFSGNSHSFLINSYQHVSREWSRKYGRVYGYYQGSIPYLVVTDANVLKQICIKDFDKFTNRQFADLPSDWDREFIVMKEDEHWKFMRHILSPTFSSSKIRAIYRILDKSVNKLTNSLINDEGDFEVDVKILAGQISFSSSIGSLCGVELEFKQNVDDPRSIQYFSKMSLEALDAKPKLDLLIEYLLPHTLLKLLNYPNLREERAHALRFFQDKSRSIINQRLKSGERHEDFLQILLDARQVEENSQTIGSKRKLTGAEILCQVVMFLLVATQTTAGLIANTLYLLAFNERIQQRLYDELASIRKVDQDGRVQFDYEDIGSHQYLDCVISESLRLMPPALYLDRKASVDYFLEDYNFTIPKGTPVLLDFYGIMTDPDYWPEPERFDPERFSLENKGNIVPGSYCPFGIGPRHCIGYRFALTEGKLAIAKLVSEFEFDVAPGAKFPPEPRKPVLIDNVYRDLRTLVRQRGRVGKSN